MAQVPISQNDFSGGIQNYTKKPTLQNGYYFGYCVNYRDDPNAITLLPGSVKESGTVVTDLLKWADLLPNTTTSFFYGNAGNLYQRSSSATWSFIHTAGASHGNGLSYFFADDYLYYSCDYTLGRYGPVSGTPTYSDDFITAQGGIPTNTASLVLTAASSMYATAANSASLDITSDITLEAYFKAASLPTGTNTMTLIGKWDESGALRCYKMDIQAISNYFGNGADGALTISVNTTDAPIDSSCNATKGTYTISATNASFAPNQKILVHQTRGTGAGTWQRMTIQSYTAGTITTVEQVAFNYTTSGNNAAQVLVIKQYTNVTINNGVTLTAKAWNGTVGGILTFLANGTVTITGTIDASGCGFLGATTFVGGTSAVQYAGEGTAGPSIQTMSANGNGGGGGITEAAAGRNDIVAGAGGSNGTQGTEGAVPWSWDQGHNSPGALSGTADLTTMTFGGGGGKAGSDYHATPSFSGNGGNGGGIIFIAGATITMTGSVLANGQNGQAQAAQGGAGGGGSILIKTQVGTLGTLSTAIGGTTTQLYDSNPNYVWGLGGTGRVHIDYYTSFTGTTSPTIDSLQDTTLGNTTGYQARIGISNDGTLQEYLSYPLPASFTTSVWNRISITWVASTSTASFYWNGILLGTNIGTKTAISNNVSLLYIGANKGASAVQNFFDGKIDDFRIWNAALSASTILANNQIQVSATAASLQAAWTFNSVYTDTTANANTLTAVNSPTFDTSDVPFPAPTTRLDIDQSYTTAGSTYTLPTAISEATNDTLPFTPADDPQKSVDFNIDTVGTGNITVTVHDQQNKVVASQTINHASLSTGFIEFIYSPQWRIVIGKTYHMHVTVSTGTSKIVSSSLNNLATADFHTYFGILVNDTQFHPIIPFLNFMAIGNERYIAKWDGAFYTPNAIAFPTGWRVRCFGTWREYLAIGVWRGTNIQDYTHGRVYFWDGIAPTFNFFIDVPDGQINALWGKDSDLYMIAGYRGDLLDYQGNFFFDTGNSSSLKLRFIPKRTAADLIEVYPGALNYYRNLIHIGVASSSNSTTITRGVYAYGTYDPQLQPTLSCDYLVSTGNTGNTVTIGLVFPVGNKLIVGWQDGIAYGADVIDFTNNPAPQGRIEMMMTDDNAVWHPKMNTQVRADFLALRSGESVDLAMSIDRAAYITSAKDSTVGDKFYTLPSTSLTNATGRGREFQLAVDLYATGTTSPTLLGVTILHDALGEEQQF
ncbi:MAG: LamG domain-containing protein [Patescibacteria group bacterium]|nr:hypothetical protein [Patescibacteria group bacterium]MDE2015876.1 LamG domain-containing protein [Patescibacteria group bacterium]MDE2233514.1 LamG domain-containing protein [Patescibacteria group bacterium]